MSEGVSVCGGLYVQHKILVPVEALLVREAVGFVLGLETVGKAGGGRWSLASR